MEKQEIIVDRWHGVRSKTEAWAACTRMAEVITANGLARRYGVKVARAQYGNGRFRDIEYRLVLVDRAPDRPRPAAVERFAVRSRRAHLSYR